MIILTILVYKYIYINNLYIGNIYINNFYIGNIYIFSLQNSVYMLKSASFKNVFLDLYRFNNCNHIVVIAYWIRPPAICE